MLKKLKKYFNICQRTLIYMQQKHININNINNNNNNKSNTIFSSAVFVSYCNLKKINKYIPE